METVAGEPLSILTQKAAKCVWGKRVLDLVTAFSSPGMKLETYKTTWINFLVLSFKNMG